MKPPAVYQSKAEGSAMWFHECDRCPHITAHWTRAEAETCADGHREVCAGEKGLR